MSLIRKFLRVFSVAPQESIPAPVIKNTSYLDGAEYKEILKQLGITPQKNIPDPFIHNPKIVDRAQIAEILARGQSPRIQFSDACYTPETLNSINALCREFGAEITVRFYGSHQPAFDASVLSYLPDVKSLIIDCHLAIKNEDEITKLRDLEKLSFGVFNYDDTEVLSRFRLGQLTELTLLKNAKRNFNLAHLADAKSLGKLYVEGHSKNIEAISQLPALKRLTLRAFPKRKGLKFLNDIENLAWLKLILGGRESLDDFQSKSLTRLEVLRVQGVQSIGSLLRFPLLEELRVEDQIKIESIDLSALNLKTVMIANCKGLSEITGLEKAPRLEGFSACSTALDMNRMLDAPWSPCVKALSLMTGSLDRNIKLRKQLDSRGYSPQFFWQP